MHGSLEIRMGHIMEALHRLQAIERQLAEIRLQREDKSRRVAHHQRQVRKADETLRQGSMATARSARSSSA